MRVLGDWEGSGRDGLSGKWANVELLGRMVKGSPFAEVMGDAAVSGWRA
jgi:hypothetical protein